MSDERTALITGLSGQDGSFLAEQYLDAGWKVYGTIRRSSRGIDLGNSKHLEGHPNLRVAEIDLADFSSILNLQKSARPNVFANAASQSHVGSSFEQPMYTMEVTGMGVLNCLEAIHQSGVHTRFCQFSSSEMFGGISTKLADENTPFYPRSPYAIAKVMGYHTVVQYRERYKMFASNAIMFNHESVRRGPTFVTRKIAQGVASIKQGLQEKLYLGNLEAKRDWGWAPEFMGGVRAILGANQPDDFVLATGETHSVREFCEECFSAVGLDYKNYVEVDPRFYRPTEVETLLGDASKIKKTLGWEPSTKFKDIARLMVEHELAQL